MDLFNRKKVIYLENLLKIKENHITKLEDFRKSDFKKIAESNALKAKIKKLEDKLRVQNEADLFFTSAKIQHELLNGKTKEDVIDLLRQQNTYQCAL